jgi:hypothetical protein
MNNFEDPPLINEDEFLALLRENMTNPPEHFNLDDEFDVLGIDSLQMLEIVAAIDELLASHASYVPVDLLLDVKTPRAAYLAYLTASQMPRTTSPILRGSLTLTTPIRPNNPDDGGF